MATPLKYKKISRAKASEALIKIEKQVLARGLDSSLTRAIGACFETLIGNVNAGDFGSNLKAKIEAALDFTACATELLHLNATFSYHNSLQQVLHIIPGRQQDFRVLKGKLWDEASIQPMTNVINYTSNRYMVPSVAIHTSPLNGGARPFAPRATAPITAPVANTSITLRAPDTPSKKPSIFIDWREKPCAWTFPNKPAPHPSTLPIPSFCK
jgi:hypothetical protein